ncbi:hypothetical protein [Massilia sp. TWR1-2-2]|uniref:hypothetical protein n=1 Tax=Massilia sp. TWR1-2-2 TaxID=2804584 RepID=UPI003CEA7B5D
MAIRAGDALAALSAAGAVADGATCAAGSGLAQAVAESTNTINIVEFRICGLNR